MPTQAWTFVYNYKKILDGYDEIFSEKKQEINRQIELFVDSYSKNNFLISTRPGSGIESFPREKITKLQRDDFEEILPDIELLR